MRTITSVSVRTLTALAMLAAASSVSGLGAQTYPSSTDPRNNLKSGVMDAGTAAQGMKLLSLTPKAAEFDSVSGLTFVNSDLAFGGKYVYQGNFSGFSIWDISNPAKPEMMSVMSCVTSQGDPSIYENLLFISAEGGGNRNDCAKGGVKDPKDHMAGVRIFDVSNPRAPKLIKNVQTCKGSHTHTLIPSKTDKDIVYIYVSGNQGARPDSELAGCKSGDDPADETNSMFRLDVIKVSIKNPQDAKVVTGARIFTGIAAAARRGGQAASSRDGRPITGPRNCHDVTAYPEMNLLAGACASHGLMVDISNPEKPVRLDFAADTNFSLWHTAVFSNDGSKVVFTDEWGGGTSPNCQQSNMMEMGGNTTLTIDRATKKMKQGAYFKIPTAQSARENCVSHNGGLIPIPGRDVMVQGWYQGGVDVIDFTDPNKPYEIAYFDRGPIDPPPLVDAGPGSSAAKPPARATIGGSWGAYYYNGMVYSSEMARGLDILELTPTEHLSANELAAAKLVQFKQYNPQSQPKIVWPAAFPVVRSYVDQLVRNNGLGAARTTAINAALNAAENASGAARRTALTELAKDVDRDVGAAQDKAKVRMLSAAIKQLAAATK